MVFSLPAAGSRAGWVHTYFPTWLGGNGSGCSLDIWQLCVALLPVIVPGAGGGPACWSQHCNPGEGFQLPERNEKWEGHTPSPLFPRRTSLLSVSLSHSLQLSPETVPPAKPIPQAQKWPASLNPKAAPPWPRSIFTFSRKPLGIVRLHLFSLGSIQLIVWNLCSGLWLFFHLLTIYFFLILILKILKGAHGITKRHEEPGQESCSPTAELFPSSKLAAPPKPWVLQMVLPPLLPQNFFLLLFILY